MSSAKTLDLAEVAVIKAMLSMRPQLSYQQILAYFTRPGRDLNHRIISQIANATLWPTVPAASNQVATAYMSAFTPMTYPRASSLLPMVLPLINAPRMYVKFDLSWWGVGQGLFMSGRLERSGQALFTWVYDCGSDSGAALRSAAIARFDRGHLPSTRIDLVTLSHFDADHINGIVELIRGKYVGTFLLPYMLPWQRLLIALEESIPVDSELFDFYLDPAGYLARLEDTEIGEIVFVPAAGPDDAPPPAPDTPEGTEPEGPAPDGDVKVDGITIDYGPSVVGEDEDQTRNAQSGIRVRRMRSAGRIVTPFLWEFIPYNDVQMLPKVTARFRKRAAFAVRIMLTRPSRRETALAFLKGIYALTFGRSSKYKNLISLFLYSGPVGQGNSLVAYAATAPVRWNVARRNFSQLSTGDGYLDSPARLQALQRFFAADQRLARAGIFQVMHHGAKGNWHKGVAAALKPAVSIFSSDPLRKRPGHPHRDVKQDFAPWSPVQVDSIRDFHIVGIVSFP